MKSYLTWWCTKKNLQSNLNNFALTLAEQVFAIQVVKKLNVKEVLKKNKYIYFFLVFVRNKMEYFISTIRFQTSKFLRTIRIYSTSPYEKLKLLKDKHRGERCFIVATAPSLVTEDLDKLKNEITFSMNSIILSFAETTWRPTYYGVQYPEFYMKYKSEIERLQVDIKFVADVISKQVKVPDDCYIYPLNMLNHNWSHNRYHTKFSDDAFAVVYSGYTITYSLLQLAVYMGFEEIYLLGVDCNYSNNTRNHIKDYGIKDPAIAEANEKMMSAYKEAKKYAELNEIKIFNATRGGKLEVFERVDLDTLFIKEKVTNQN